MAKSANKKKKLTGRRSTASRHGSASRSPTTPPTRGRTRNTSPKTTGKHLVIVESPTKAKTINKYLGPDYVVMASVGHVRDLPKRAPKGSKQPVPGVDLENNFAPTYEVLEAKEKTVRGLTKAAKDASDVWFATDLDREGESIAWHLAQALKVPIESAKRVVFNAITKDNIQHAFENPRRINEKKVNAQQARRILDRIVGYQVSPFLWKKVAGGLSAGRVQSVAVQLVVTREREIDAFNPDEYWKIMGTFCIDVAKSDQLGRDWNEWLKQSPEGKTRTVKEKNGWLNTHQCVHAELVKFNDEPFKADNRKQALAIAESLGFDLTNTIEKNDPEAKGPAKSLCQYEGHLSRQRAPDYAITSIKTTRTKSRPTAPFITSTLQQTAANRLGFSLEQTMRIAQQLYEGVDIHGTEGQTGLITYMRTDSVHLTKEAVNMARSYISQEWGEQYVPQKPNMYTSSNQTAQEAHEAIRPTNILITPKRVRRDLTDVQFKLYRLIWERFLGCQSMPAEWDLTTILIETKNGSHSVFKCNGRTLVFDGYYKAVGLPTGENAILPPLSENQPVGPMTIEPTQHFTNPPPRYTEASLQKKLEEEGIGRPSTYAQIISTIQRRKYVQAVARGDRRLMATDLGKVVADMLTAAFPKVMDIAYTRDMENELDKVEDEHHDWTTMLHNFYGPFKASLDRAHEEMTHAKAVTEPASFKCEKCDASTMYRFGKNGRFLSCSRYPDCDYAAPIDRKGRPMKAVLTNILCPQCDGKMTMRHGRFGPFLGCQNYPQCSGLVKLDAKKGTIVLPKPPPLLTDVLCPKCDSQLNLRRSKRGPWLSCARFPKCRGRAGWTKIEEKKQSELEKALAKHEADHPQPPIHNNAGQIIGEDYVPSEITEDPTPASLDSDAA